MFHSSTAPPRHQNRASGEPGWSVSAPRGTAGVSLPLPATKHAVRGSLSRSGEADRVAARSVLDGETRRASRGRAQREGQTAQPS